MKKENKEKTMMTGFCNNKKKSWIGPVVQMILITYRKRPVVLIGPPNIGRHELRQVDKMQWCNYEHVEHIY